MIVSSSRAVLLFLKVNGCCCCCCYSGGRLVTSMLVNKSVLCTASSSLLACLVSLPAHPNKTGTNKQGHRLPGNQDNCSLCINVNHFISIIQVNKTFAPPATPITQFTFLMVDEKIQNDSPALTSWKISSKEDIVYPSSTLYLCILKVQFKSPFLTLTILLAYNSTLTMVCCCRQYLNPVS